MLKSSKLISLILVFALLTMTACKKDEPVELIYEFNVGGTTYQVRASESALKQERIEIPSEYNGIPVTALMNRGFEGAKVKYVYIPDNVNDIGHYTFYNCAKLEEVRIPSGIEEIGANCFNLCVKLKSINIPDTVKYIDEAAFYKCSSLTSVTIPDSVVYINSYAFAYCENLEEIKFSKNIKDIFSRAFYGCKNLREISIPEGINQLNPYTFYGCEKLQRVVIPSSMAYIGGAFSCCGSLSEIFYKGTEDDWNKIKINDDRLPFAECYYYSESEPAEDGNFWHYDANGEIKIW